MFQRFLFSLHFLFFVPCTVFVKEFCNGFVWMEKLKQIELKQSLVELMTVKCKIMSNRAFLLPKNWKL